MKTNEHAYELNMWGEPDGFRKVDGGEVVVVETHQDSFRELRVLFKGGAGNENITKSILNATTLNLAEG